MRKPIFAAATALMLGATSPAFAEGGWSSDQMSSRNGDRGGGSQSGSSSALGSPWGLLDDLARHFGFGSDRAPQKFESSSRRGHDPFNNPTPGQGMTGGDAHY